MLTAEEAKEIAEQQQIRNVQYLVDEIENKVRYECSKGCLSTSVKDILGGLDFDTKKVTVNQMRHNGYTFDHNWETMYWNGYSGH